MQIIPDLYNGEWKFCEDDPKSVTEVCGISDVKSLTPDQIRQLNCVVDAAFKKMGDKLDCTHLVEHRIVTSSPPIKQRYYPLSPALQQVVNKELDALLAKVLTCPDFTQPFFVETDASSYGLGVVLTQRQNGQEKKELLAVLFGVEKLRPYIEGTHFTVVTDHYSLKWLFSIKEPTGRIARWQLRLQAFDFDVIHRKGKDHIVPDVLSRSVPIIDVVDVDVTHPSAGGAVSTDPWYSGMIQKVTSSPDKYPLWRVRGKQLYKHVEYPYPSLTQADNWILVVPKNQRQNIIGEHHNPPTCAHLGTYKTLARISAKYYWPKMRADVARPWQSLSVDVVGPLPRSSQGYSYILSVLDVFSKFVLFFPMRRATAAIIAKLIEEQVFLVYGVPSRLVTDNGAHFKNKLLANLFKKYEVQHRFTALYHAQANAVERHHRVLKTALSSYVAENQRQWDRYLPQVAAAIRSAKSEVTQVTPNFVIFGREIILSGKDHHVDQDGDFQPMQRHEALKYVFRDVQDRLKQAYTRSSQHYNLRRRPDTFALDQMVWKRNYTTSDAIKGITAKLSSKFVGPFRISKIVSPWVYQLVDENGRDKGIWAAKDLKAHPPDTSEDE
nr:unnamed protein product [Callosobruchus analis]